MGYQNYSQGEWQVARRMLSAPQEGKSRGRLQVRKRGKRGLESKIKENSGLNTLTTGPIYVKKCYIT